MPETTIYNSAEEAASYLTYEYAGDRMAKAAIDTMRREIARLRGISHLLARSQCGISPDSNTQNEAEIASTEDAIQNAIQEALQFHA